MEIGYERFDFGPVHGDDSSVAIPWDGMQTVNEGEHPVCFRWSYKQ